MILPIMQQPCVVTDDKGVQHMGIVEKAYVDFKGAYLIGVWSRSWGYVREFTPASVRLMSVVFDDGEVYNAEAAFKEKYPEGVKTAKPAPQVEVNTAGRPQYPTRRGTTTSRAYDTIEVNSASASMTVSIPRRVRATPK